MSETPGHQGFVVSGRVQGVGFRWWTRDTARRLGLAGTVRNLPDGRVEVQARGDPAALARFELDLRRGPTGARVLAVDRIPFRSRRNDVADDFRILAT